MRPVLFDSDILIEVFRARDLAVLTRWKELSEGEVPVFCSPVSVAELWHGARLNEHATLEALFAGIPCLSIDHDIGKRAGEFLRAYAKSHNLELGDALIAATAVVHQLNLWTRSRRHYPMRDVTFF